MLPRESRPLPLSEVQSKYTEHERVDLPIGADLAAADEAILAERVVRAGERIGP